MLGVMRDTSGAWAPDLNAAARSIKHDCVLYVSRVVPMRSCMPDVLVFDQAVTVPVVWITTHYCFVQVQLKAMHDVLVHAASGGVGLVSVEWVTRARAIAHGTAGAVSKHALLRSCEVVRLSSSRDAAACANLLSCILRGRRLHSLVSALSNDFVCLSLALLAPQGVFLEVGKNDIWSQDRSLAAMPSVDYVAAAVDDGCRSCPGWNVDPRWFNSELQQLSARARAGEVQPLPIEGFAFEERAVQAALRLLQRGANIGKVVVRVGMREPMVEEQQAPSLQVQLKGRGQERGTDLGVLVGLGIDAEGGVAVLELRDPQRFNTMGWALGDDMTRAASHLRQQCLGGVRALTLQGAGSTFCAGGNPYGTGGSTSLMASYRALLASVQVCLRGDHRKFSRSPSYLLPVCSSGLHRCACYELTRCMRCAWRHGWRRGSNLLAYRLAYCRE